MLSSSDFVLLYDKVLLTEAKNYHVLPESFQSATKNLKDTYRSNPSVWNEEISRNADYNDAAHRCAYLHKYAPIHSSMVQDMLCRAFEEGSDIFRKTLSDSMSCLNICSLGGGPGVDVIGVLSALHKEFGLQRCSVQVVDCMLGWKNMFTSLVEELQEGYGNISRNFNADYLQHSFIAANLLGDMNTSVITAIRSANLITMIKFLSGATCKNTEQMVRRIFNSMKHGAFLLFIDNASGGFVELVSRIGKECRLLPEFGPLAKVYLKKGFRSKKCGFQSCFSIRVSVLLLRKQLKETEFLSHPLNQYKENESLARNFSGLANLCIKVTRHYEENYDVSRAINQYDYIDDQWECSDEDYDYTVEHYDCYVRDEENHCNGPEEINQYDYTDGCDYCGEVTVNCRCYNHSSEDNDMEHFDCYDRGEENCNVPNELNQYGYTDGCEHSGERTVNCSCYNVTFHNDHDVKRYVFYDRDVDYRNGSDEFNQYDNLKVQCMW